MPKAKDTGSGKRKDNRGIVLNKGESQIAGGKYRYRYYDDKGNPHDITAWRLRPEDPTPAGHKPEKSLREKEKDIRRQLDEGLKTWGAGTVKDLVKKFMEKNANHWSPGTKSQYEGYFKKHIESSAFGRKKVAKLTPDNVIDFYTGLCDSEEGMKVSSLGNVDKLINPAFAWAVKQRIIPTNPVTGAVSEVKKALNQPKRKRHALESSQLDDFLKFAQENYPEHYNLLYFLAWTGCRIGEALGLSWDCIDFGEEIIHIRKTLEYHKVNDSYQFIWKAPKTEAGIREIPMLKDVKDILTGMRPDKNDKVIPISRKEPTLKDLVFLEDGEPMRAVPVYYIIQRIVKAYNAAHKEKQIEDLSAHTFRHTFTCWLIENFSCGENAPLLDNLKYIQGILGHTDASTTLNTYAELRPEKLKEKHDILRAAAGNR